MSTVWGEKSHLDRFDYLCQTYVDTDGRIYKLDQKDENKIYLTTDSGRETRAIGKILVGKHNLLYWKWEDEKNIFKQTDAWSVNLYIFEEVDHIVYETTRYIYQIPRIRAEEFGKRHQFAHQEWKIYIPLKYWDKRHKGIDEKELKRRNLVGDSWYPVMKPIFEQPFMTELGKRLHRLRANTVIFPNEDRTFRAFKLCSFEHTKVVILGQDPYHQPNVADGLAFSVATGGHGTIANPVNRSIDVVLEEIETSMYDGLNLSGTRNLERLAHQGVLLLNTILTVQKNKPLSHKDMGWEKFTKRVLLELVKDTTPKVFMIWGAEARNLFKEVTDRCPAPQHLLLFAKHPASDLYGADATGKITPNYPNTFRGCKHFSKANSFLIKHNRREIVW